MLPVIHQLTIPVLGFEPERIKLPVGVKELGGRRFQGRHARARRLLSRRDLYWVGVKIVTRRERVPAVRRTKFDRRAEKGRAVRHCKTVKK